LLRAGRNATSQALSQKAAEENLIQGGRSISLKAVFLTTENTEVTEEIVNLGKIGDKYFRHSGHGRMP